MKTSPARHQHVPLKEKTILYIAHLLIFCTSTETSIYYKLKDKILLICFKHQINITVVLLSCGYFCPVEVSDQLLGKWNK